jgi:cyclophilin family peptidyl-prolyl cis-trans isomerase
MSAKRRAEEARRRRNERIRFFALFVVALIVLGGAAFLVMNLRSEEPAAVATEVDFGDPGPLADMAPVERADYYSAPPEMTIDPDKEYEAVIRTEKGDMRLRLFAQESPMTVNNFVFLARQGYYDGTIFHRVIEDFMAQAGDPTGTGAGGPGYAFADEVDSGLAFDRAGLLAMANSGANTNGSQFFITYAPTPWLDGAHTIFGELIEGQEVLNSLTLVEPGSSPTPQGDVIERIAIIES